MTPSASFAQNDSVGELKIKTAAVSETKLKDGAVSEFKLQDNSVGESKLKVDSVSTLKVRDDAVTPAKIDFIADDIVAQDGQFMVGSTLVANLSPKQ